MVINTMQVVNSSQVIGKRVLLRLDIDVPIENGVVTEDFRLKAGLPTVKMCLENASQVIAIGHIGRPGGKVVPELSVKPVKRWFADQGFELNILENLRFDPREDTCNIEYARELAKLGEIYVNEAFAAHHPAASTTVLPTLLPHCVGLRFAKEIEVLTKVRNNPQKPFVAIIGGVKVEDKLPVIQFLEGIADSVLVGGKIAKPEDLNNEGTDINDEAVRKWGEVIKTAKMIVWNGPVGKFEDPQNSATKEIAGMVLSSKGRSASGREVIIGGGDTIAALGQYGLLSEAEKKAFSASDSEREDAKADKPSIFISTGGGAMSKFLISGTLPTIEALQ